MSIFDDVNNWEKKEGAELISSMISVSDPVILDYGCGAGNYSFAAAYAFGNICKISAVDINKQCLDYVNEKASNEKLDCITTVMGREDYKHDFEDNTFDLVIQMPFVPLLIFSKCPYLLFNWCNKKVDGSF